MDPPIHGDICSSNILLTPDMQPVIARWGLALTIPDDKAFPFSTLVGSAGYIDPACYHDNHLTVEFDVYYFGVLLLELVSGRCALIHDGEECLVLHYNLITYSCDNIF